MTGKYNSTCTVFWPLLNYIKIGIGPGTLFLRRHKEHTEPVPSLLPCVGISFPISSSLYAPVFCEKIYVHGAQASPLLSIFQIPWGRGQHCKALRLQRVCPGK